MSNNEAFLDKYVREFKGDFVFEREGIILNATENLLIMKEKVGVMADELLKKANISKKYYTMFLQGSLRDMLSAYIKISLALGLNMSIDFRKKDE